MQQLPGPRAFADPVSASAVLPAHFCSVCALHDASWYMQVGEAGLGKTTFIQNLQAALQPELPSPRSPHPEPEPVNLYEVFKHSPEQLCAEVIISTDSSRFHYLLQVLHFRLFAAQGSWNNPWSALHLRCISS